jgi:hypothetical protein
VNIFVKIERLKDFQFRKVRYYSVHFEKSEVNELFDFLNRIEDIEELENDLSNLLVWLEEIGENYGARNRFFRNESLIADVKALPPPRKQMIAKEIVVNDLRLYCMVLNENVVFLFNGGLKTTDKAQDCPNIGIYFKQANQLAVRIEQLFKDGEIIWNKNYTDIYFDENLEIEI